MEHIEENESATKQHSWKGLWTMFEMWKYRMEEWFGASIDYYEGNKLYIV